MATNTVIIDSKNIDKSTQSIKEYCKKLKNAASGTASLTQATDKLNAIAVECSDALNNLKGTAGKTGSTVINISLNGLEDSGIQRKSAINKLLSDKKAGDPYSVAKKENESYNYAANEVSSLATSLGPYGVAAAAGTRGIIYAVNKLDKKTREIENNAISVIEYYDSHPQNNKEDYDSLDLALGQLIRAVEREKLLKAEQLEEAEAEYKAVSAPISLSGPYGPRYKDNTVIPPKDFTNPSKLAVDAQKKQLESDSELLAGLKKLKIENERALNSFSKNITNSTNSQLAQSEDSKSRLSATIILQQKQVNFAEQYLIIRRQEREEERKAQELALVKAKEDERNKKILVGQQYARDVISKANPPSALDQINNNEKTQLAIVEQNMRMDDIVNYQLYEEAKTAIVATASQQRIELHRQEEQAQIASLQSGMSSMSGAVGGLMNVAELMGGKDSAAYQQLFAISKGFAVSQAMISLQLAIMQAMSDSTAMTPMQKFANMAAVAAAGAGVLSTLASVTLSGQAHSGIDFIPREGTWLLDRGERVVDSRTNADLKQFLNNTPSSGGGSSLSINVPVTVQNEGGGSSMSAEGLSQLAGMIKNKVYEVVSNEQRPGGLFNRGAYA